MAGVRDGTSNVYMVGEKYLCADRYDTGTDISDDHSMLAGDDYDVHAWTLDAPLRDRRGERYYWRFGSAHSSTWQVSLCDGSVRGVSYTIDQAIHRRLGHRHDGRPVGEF